MNIRLLVAAAAVAIGASAAAVVRVARIDYVDPQVTPATVVYINGIHYIPEPPAMVPVMHLLGDWDYDCDVDVDDLDIWMTYLDAATNGLSWPFRYHYHGDDLLILGDLDGDNDIDIEDYAVMQRQRPN